MFNLSQEPGRTSQNETAPQVETAGIPKADTQEQSLQANEKVMKIKNTLAVARSFIDAIEGIEIVGKIPGYNSEVYNQQKEAKQQELIKLCGELGIAPISEWPTTSADTYAWYQNLKNSVQKLEGNE